MAARNSVRQSTQRAQPQKHKSKKASFCPPRRGFGFHSQSAPAFANVPADALVKHAITTSAAAPIQAKLTVGAANDPYEQEADRVARQVVTEIRTPQFRVNREEEASVQPQREFPRFQVQAQSDGGGAMAAPQAVERGIAQARGKGQPLKESVREPMERAFGADFDGVRVHTDGQADQLSQSIQAKAFTTGRDVFFRAGAYQPGSKGGQELIAHELTHVVQQGGGVGSGIIQAKGFKS
ncbi:MAG: DUF4157 domain-containing protein, partial [Spirulina sp. SIO3F2]|nr:DUF4157 domain-containing protein [Spirulina sp. SIO3F2]